MTYLAVKNVQKYQHYKERRPPWVKLYQDVLEDVEFTRLPDASRAHLMCIWLLASRYDNRIPNDAKWIEKAIIASGPVDVDLLVSAGFLIVCEDASAPLAKPSENARTEDRGERSETDSPSSAGAPAVEFDAVAELLSRIPETSRPAWAAEITAAEQGMHGPPLARERIIVACRDYVGNGIGERPSLRHFRGYLENAGKARASPRQPRPSKQAAGRADLAAWLSSDSDNGTTHG